MSRSRSSSPVRWTSALPLELHDHTIWTEYVPNLYPTPEPFHGGFPGGCVVKKKRGTSQEYYRFQIRNIQLAHGEIYKGFFKSEYGGNLEKTLEAAINYQKEFSTKRNLWKNQYRHIADGVVEIILTQGHTTIVDIESLARLRQQTWRSMNHSHSTRAPLIHAKGTCGELMETVVFGAGPNERVMHLNGHSLDNRLANLAPAFKAELRRMDIRNTTGRTGVCNAVYKKRPYFFANWKENHRRSCGKRHYYKKGDADGKQAAFELACQDREAFEARRDLIVTT
jgi:hypothetical protein